MHQAAKEGIKVGLVRPITLWPFPSQTYADIAAQSSVKAILDIELNCGQMVEDVRLAVNGVKPVHFHGRTGGNLPTVQEILELVRQLAGRSAT